MEQLKPPYRLIRDRLYQGKVIPFLGSGASLVNVEPDERRDNNGARHLPNVWELTQHLAKQTGFPEGEPLDLAKVAQYFDLVGGRTALREELHGIFNRNYSPALLHSYLADVPLPLLIVTTNYDDLIERAFSAKKDRAYPYDVVVHTTEPTFGDHLLWWPHGEETPRKLIPKNLDINLNAVTVIYKIHGAVDRHDPERDQYVITEDDYINFLGRMSRNNAPPKIFAELFLGYGLRDWNLRVIFNRIRKHKEQPHWAIQDNPSPLEQTFWRERGVLVYDMKIEEFVSELTSLRE